MYILKIQGTEKIPDYIQIRDENLSLIAYFKVSNPKTALMRCNLLHKMKDILDIAGRLKYGEIQELKL